MDLLSQIFNTFGVSWSKFIAQVILFLIVYFVLDRYAFGPIIAMFQERRRRIEEGQVNAEKIKKQLADAEARYQEVLRKANETAQGLIDEARKSGEAISHKQLQEAIRQAGDIIAKASESITVEREKMVAEVKKEMVDLVVETTAKVAGKVLTPADQQRLSEETARQLAA